MPDFPGSNIIGVRMVDASGNAAGITEQGTANVGAGQVSVGASATLIVAARAGRRSVVIVNEGATDIRLGGSGVTAATGALLPGTKGAAFTIDTAAAVYGIVASGTQTVSYVETY